MLIGRVEVDGRLVLFAEFVDRRDMQYGREREVAGEDVAALLAAGLPDPENTCGFRFFNKVVASATVGANEVELYCPHVETGPRHLVGTLVGRDYLVSRAANPPSFGIHGLDGLIRRLDETPGARVIRFGDDDRHYRVIGPEDIVIDSGGNPVTAILGPPEGWIQPTRFQGGSFLVEVVGGLVTTRVTDAVSADGIEVHFEVADHDSGLSRRILDASAMTCPGVPVPHGSEGGHDEKSGGLCDRCAHPFSGVGGKVYRTDVSSSPRGGSICLREPDGLSFDIGKGRTLRLAWDGAALTVELQTT